MRVGDKPLRRQPGTLQIAARQPDAAEVQLPHNPEGTAQAPHPAHRPDNSPSDGRQGWGRPPRPHDGKSRRSSLRSAVEIGQPPELEATRNLAPEFAGEGFTAERQMIQRRGGWNVAEDGFEKRRHATDERHAVALELPPELSRRLRTASLITTAAPPPIQGSNACSIEGSNAEEIKSAERKRTSTSKSRPSASSLLVRLACATTTAFGDPLSPRCR